MEREVAEGLVQISLSLKLQLELVLQKRLSVQSDNKAANEQVFGGQGILV